jgi:hypothetical protein
MHGENGAGQPGAGNFQAREHAPQQNGADRLQDDVHGMIAAGIVSPHQPFGRPGAKCEREIGLEPDRVRRQFAGENGVAVGNEPLVVHDKAAGQDGQINDEHERDEEECVREELEFFFDGRALKPGTPLLLPEWSFAASAKKQPPGDFHEITVPVIRSPGVRLSHLLLVGWSWMKPDGGSLRRALLLEKSAAARKWFISIVTADDEPRLGECQSKITTGF